MRALRLTRLRAEYTYIIRIHNLRSFRPITITKLCSSNNFAVLWSVYHVSRNLTFLPWQDVANKVFKGNHRVVLSRVTK